MDLPQTHLPPSDDTDPDTSLDMEVDIHKEASFTSQGKIDEEGGVGNTEAKGSGRKKAKGSGREKAVKAGVEYSALQGGSRGGSQSRRSSRKSQQDVEAKASPLKRPYPFDESDVTLVDGRRGRLKRVK